MSVGNKRVLAVELDTHAAGLRSEPKQFARQWAAGADRARRFGLHDLRKRWPKDHDHPFAGFGIDIRSPHAIATATSKTDFDGLSSKGKRYRNLDLGDDETRRGLAARKNGLGLSLTH